MKKVLFAAFASLVSSFAFAQEPLPAAEFNIATYNIRLPARSDSLEGNGWGTRLPHLAGLIRFHDFDIFGTQEGVSHQLDSLKSRLSGYDFIGVGRDDGKKGGEHAAIFYDTAVFDVLDHGDFWLSETPDRPSLGWDAACRRVCTWGHFLHKPSGRQFLYFNLHMDHIGVKARQESVALIKQKIKDFPIKGLPVFLSGDFNIDQNNPLIAGICDDGTFKDSYLSAAYVYEPNGTFNNFNPQGFTASRIDHIFVSPEVEVEKYGILTDTYRVAPDGSDARFDDSMNVNVATYIPRTPSDHYPVMLRVNIR